MDGFGSSGRGEGGSATTSLDPPKKRQRKTGKPLDALLLQHHFSSPIYYLRPHFLSPSSKMRGTVVNRTKYRQYKQANI